MPLTLGFETRVEYSGIRSGLEGDIVHVPYFHIAALVLAVYDQLLTFDREVEYIWSRPDWSISTILFILSRYGGNVMLIVGGIVFLNPHATQPVSNIGIKVTGVAAIIVILLSQAVMQLRVKTLYRRSMSTIINIMWGAEIAISVCIGLSTTFALKVDPITIGPMKICRLIYFPRYASSFWLPVLLFEVFLFTLVFRVAWHNYQQFGSWRGAALLHVVLRDNFSYFVLVFVAYVLTAILWLTQGPHYFLAPTVVSCSITTVMGCRFILNLCQVYHRPRGVITDSAQSRPAWTPAVICGLHFVDFPEPETPQSHTSGVGQIPSRATGEGEEV